MKSHDLRAGIYSGLAGIAVLGLCMLALHWTLVPSLVVAVVVCVAVMLIAPGGPLEVIRTKPTEAEARAIAAVRQKIAEVAAFGKQLSPVSPRGADLNRQVVEKMTRIIDVIAEDRNKFKAADPFLKDIEPVSVFFEAYTKLVVRRIKTAEATIKDAEERQLPRLIQRFDNLFERLHSYDAAWLETETEVTLPNIGDVDFKLEGAQQ